jgi:AcrR family transcriptional regulator
MKGEQTRQRVVSTALRLFHERGYGNTSLADVAEQSGLLKGNLAYYFKTKPDLLRAVTEARQHAVGVAISGDSSGGSLSLDVSDAPPLAVVERLLAHVETSAPELAVMGCPLGSLSTELGKLGDDDLHPQAAALLTGLLEWLRAQFARSCTAEDAMRHAEHVLTCLQGAAVVAQASRDPGVVIRQVDGLRRWLTCEVFGKERSKSGSSAPKPTSTAARAVPSKRSKPQ